MQPSLKASPSGTEWDFMDEAILTHSIYNRGYSNWTQVKEFMDYNQSPFSMEEINLHYEKYHYNQPDHTLIMPTSIQKALPHTSYG